jgi:carotenoid cleavage dioxygenase
VEDESGRPLAAMLVRAYDKDVVLDDFLGEARTDDSGRFEVVFSEDRFKDLFETRPDLYLHVFDPRGARLLHTTEHRVRFDAGRDEFFEIRVARDGILES